MTFTGILDKSAISLSVLCMLHCVALPVAILMVPSFSAYWFADEHFHLTLIYLVLPTSVLAIGMGCHRHRTYKITLWGLSGLLVLSVAALFGHDYLGIAAEKGLTMVGAALVMVAHIYNYRLCRSTNCQG